MISIQKNKDQIWRASQSLEVWKKGIFKQPSLQCSSNILFTVQCQSGTTSIFNDLLTIDYEVIISYQHPVWLVCTNTLKGPAQQHAMAKVQQSRQ